MKFTWCVCAISSLVNSFRYTLSLKKNWIISILPFTNVKIISVKCTFLMDTAINKNLQKDFCILNEHNHIQLKILLKIFNRERERAHCKLEPKNRHKAYILQSTSKCLLEAKEYVLSSLLLIEFNSCHTTNVYIVH